MVRGTSRVRLEYSLWLSESWCCELWLDVNYQQPYHPVCVDCQCDTAKNELFHRGKQSQKVELEYESSVLFSNSTLSSYSNHNSSLCPTKLFIFEMVL